MSCRHYRNMMIKHQIYQHHYEICFVLNSKIYVNKIGQFLVYQPNHPSFGENFPFFEWKKKIKKFQKIKFQI